jgi:FtsP/CotA-like multicopper oxidase with cupredoxin domain
MWNQMRMSPTDLADVSAQTYTYLVNGTTAAGNWTGLFRPGETVRLRLINSGAMTFFDVRIPGLKMTVVQADGQNVEPVTVDEIRLGVAETYDVLVTPKDEAYTLFAQSMDRSGYARGTLAVRAGLSAPVPAPDRPAPLEMEDMMGDMTGVARAHHARSEYGPSTDMRVDTPRTNLDDPGVGLRDNGRRVLTYADLRTLGGPLDKRQPEREIELHLTGNMERYVWSIDGLEFGRSTPVHFRHNERLRVVFVNDTMMAHPMHLHGFWKELENEDGEFLVRKHTVVVQPAQRVSLRITADALGRWAWHCHLLIHMDTGMFREVVVS